jgi:hypothetical protein
MKAKYFGCVLGMDRRRREEPCGGSQSCWAAIHSESMSRDIDYHRADRPLRARDLHIDRFDYVPDGRRLMGFTVKPIAGAD